MIKNVMKNILIALIFFAYCGSFSQEAVVSELQITGLKRTKESFIRKLVKVKPGSTYDSLRVATDIERLKSCLLYTSDAADD